jgi:hypothetical protein
MAKDQLVCALRLFTTPHVNWARPIEGELSLQLGFSCYKVGANLTRGDLGEPSA